jgi:uroporphyrin-3 C-methyltransferase
LVGALAIGLALVVGIVWFEGREAQRALRTEVAKRLTDSDAATAQAKAHESDLANELREAQAKLALLEARLAESQSQQASLEALYRELAPSRDELALNEVEQVLLLASQQLAIARNVQSALAALQLADAKLARVDRPQLVALRRALARDIDRLKSVPYVDVSGMSLKLDQVLSTIDTLPLAKDERLPAPLAPPPPGDEPEWRKLLREAWAEVKALVRVEVADRPAAPLVPPPQQYFLRENLRLRLLAARIALLSHDDNGFKADVTATNAWVKQYFDTRTKSVQALSATLTQLAATPMPAELPDLAATLTAVRSVKATRERAGERGAGGTAAPR